jgi:hypothetical protein
MVRGLLLLVDMPEKRFFQESLVAWPTSLLTMRSLGSQSPRLENRKVPPGKFLREEPLVPELTFPKRHKHRDVRSREPLTPPKVDKVRQAAPYRPPWRAQRQDDSPGLPAWLACCCTHAPALGSGRPRSGALARQAHQERGPSTHPLTGTAMHALRKRKPLAGDAAYVFFSERQGPLTDSSVRTMIARAGELPGLGFPVHPHQLRPGCG